MAIHSICLVKNEADIIERTLTEASGWSDFIYVYDNGSTDGTWEKVLALAASEPRIVPFRSDDAPYDNNLRRLPFAHYRDRCQPGDWWCQLDADEIYIDSPRDFLAQVPLEYDTIWSVSFQYFFTDEDLARYEADPSRYADDVPLELKCRYYSNNWSEIRFFRYHPRLQWHTGKLPYPLLKPFERRIRLKHYPYRSPQQIERRLATRRAAIQRGRFRHERPQNFSHVTATAPIRPRYREDRKAPESWRSRVARASSLILDDGRTYAFDESLLPPIAPAPDSMRRRLKRAWARLSDELDAVLELAPLRRRSARSRRNFSRPL
jgi:glycosyltransferase involved in cell wall biosynthesis